MLVGISGRKSDLADFGVSAEGPMLRHAELHDIAAMMMLSRGPPAAVGWGHPR
jgi:hypothetical protein